MELLKVIINLTILECKCEQIDNVYRDGYIINLTILECKLKNQYNIDTNQADNKSNHIGM